MSNNFKMISTTKSFKSPKNEKAFDVLLDELSIWE